MPDATTQYDTATSGAALFDLTDRAQIELRGADRQTFLNNFCTNDVKKLKPGQGCEAFVTSIKGRILGHIIVSAAENSLWIDSVPGANEFLVGHLDKYLITEDVEILDRSAELGPLGLIGPQAVDWLGGHGIDVSDLRLWGQQTATLEGIPVLVRRVGFTQPPAFEIVVSHNERPQLQDTITAAGVAPGSREVFEFLRIEAGFPHYGIDLTDENIAQESGRAKQAISFTKGCYLGQEPIARLDALGHTNKELRRLNLATGPVPQRGTAVLSPTGDTVGQITSAVLSPTDGPTVALAMLRMSVTVKGTELTLSGQSAWVT